MADIELRGKKVVLPHETWQFTPVEKFADFFGDGDFSRVSYKVVSNSESAPSDESSICGLSKFCSFENVSCDTDKAAAESNREHNAESEITISADESGKTVDIVLTPDFACVNCDKDQKLYKGDLRIVIEQNAHANIYILNSVRMPNSQSDKNSMNSGGEYPLKIKQSLNVELQKNAELNLYSILQWESNITNYCLCDFEVGESAELNHYSITLSGDCTRVEGNVKFTGEHGRYNAKGSYFVSDGHFLEQRFDIDHEIQNCTSNMDFKGALAGKDTRSVWVGSSFIGKDANDTDTYERNQNLILSEGAVAMSIPNLEILSGNINKAGHASVIGKLDKDQLFYLMARGIDEKTAKKLVLQGFFEETVNGIENEFVRETIDKKLTEVFESI